MRNFLPAGIINDTIADIIEKILELKRTLKEGDENGLERGLNELEEMALDLGVFIEKFPCQPLIYTGQGSTEEIISRLEWALTFTEGINPLEYYSYQDKKRHMR